MCNARTCCLDKLALGGILSGLVAEGMRGGRAQTRSRGGRCATQPERSVGDATVSRASRHSRRSGLREQQSAARARRRQSAGRTSPATCPRRTLVSRGEIGCLLVSVPPATSSVVQPAELQTRGLQQAKQAAKCAGERALTHASAPIRRKRLVKSLFIPHVEVQLVQVTTESVQHQLICLLGRDAVEALLEERDLGRPVLPFRTRHFRQ